MNKEQLQKLAGLLKEVEDFDLSDNPVAGYPKTMTITLDTDEVVEALRQRWDIGELNKDLVLQIQAAIQDEVKYNFTENDTNLGDLWRGGFLDNIDLDAVNEAEDFDLSDNPVPNNQTLSFTLSKEPRISLSKDFTIDIKDFITYVQNDFDGDIDLEDIEDIKEKLVAYLEEEDLVDGDEEWTNDGYALDGDDYLEYYLTSELDEKDYKNIKKYLKKK
jgi:hypothetical protein